jgi:triacylglycerol esterase/lipase EstA (alpha/beta hydrolase family)
MHSTWLTWLWIFVGLGVLAAVLFVAASYGLAVALTRGAFGWPGVAYFVRETLWVVLTQSALPAGWLRSQALPDPRARPPGDVGAAPRRPIVLVHGFTQNRTNFMWLSRHLAGRGHGPFFGFDYQSFQPVEVSAGKLRAFVEQVTVATGAEHVDLVCHSLGGLVARTYVDLMGGHARVRRVVTLGTPHRGIRHANGALLGASVRDMQPRTGFIAKLDGAPVPEAVRYLSIYSVHDNIVFPGTASSIEGRGSDVIVERHGHFGILFSEQVAEHVHQGLTAGRDGV